MNKEKIALTIIRFAAAGNMLIHGIARIVNDGVTPFDGFLSGLGFPPYTAWVITGFEITASVLLIAGKWIIPICSLFILQLIMGIVLVHGAAGWFVVGAGRNGMEYSVLLIVCFFATAWHGKKA
ncbi:MAG: DoxX family protein [Cyclobacteriaceae bacterium]|nr:DoxX family protein [Cyclobacteriaceae bacterium]